MDDYTQEAMLRCMHVLSITGCKINSYRETDLNINTSQVPNITLPSGPLKYIGKQYRPRSYAAECDD